MYNIRKTRCALNHTFAISVEECIQNLEFCMAVGEQYKNIIYICIDKVCITT